jgi:hypothetical protein
MVVQDALTGYVHEAPDIGYAEAPDAFGQVAYDGYGNPVGLLPGLMNLFRGRRRRSAPMAPPPEPMPPAPDMPPPDMPPPEAGTGEVAYDGFGNPVGFINVLPAALRFTPPGLRFTPPRVAWSPILRRFVRWVFSPTQRRWVQLPAAPGAAPGAMPYRRPWPLGWQRPSLPYTGLGPNRLYMRCAVWPGPKGLVPALAMQAAAAGAAGGRRRRRRRRR